MAKGTIDTITRKNTTPIVAEPPMRRATRRSRRNRASSGELTAFAPSASSRASSRPSGSWVAATIMPPSARCSVISRASRSREARVERAGRLVEQPQRPEGDQQARERDAALLARRRAWRLASARDGRARPAPAPRAGSRLRRSGSPPRNCAQNSEIFARGERRLQPVGMGEIMKQRRGLLPLLGPVDLDAAAPGAAKGPARARKSVDLPAPLRPVTISASPRASEKPRPDSTRRPPRATASASTRSRRAEAAFGVRAGNADAERLSSPEPIEQVPPQGKSPPRRNNLRHDCDTMLSLALCAPKDAKPAGRPRASRGIGRRLPMRRRAEPRAARDSG